MVAWLQRQIDKPWYPVLLAAAGFIDVWVIVLPTDGLVIASILSNPRKWRILATAFTIGSTLGGMSVALLASHFGLGLIESAFPGFIGTSFWLTTESWLASLGLWAVFLIAASPLSQQPAIALASMAGHSVLSIFLALLIGRALKYYSLGYLCKWAPNRVRHLWGFRKEIEKVEHPKNKKGNSE